MEDETSASFVDSLFESLEDVIRTYLAKKDPIEDIEADHLESLLEKEKIFIKVPKPSSNVLSGKIEDFKPLYYYTVLNGTYREIIAPSSSNEPDSIAIDRIYDSIFGEYKNSVDISCFPMKPYSRELAKVIGLWKRSDLFPIQFSRMKHLEETEDDTTRMNELTPRVLSLLSDWFGSSKQQRFDIALKLLQLFKVRGVLTILRVRKTKGSVNVFPPSCKEMIASFNSSHSEKSPGVFLTTGARALSKHYFRSRNGWWGKNTGSDPQKNKQAEDILINIIKNCKWLNIHLLPHQLIIFETRLKEGYGVRWIGDGTDFRGFLEPQSDVGHELGWIHD